MLLVLLPVMILTGLTMSPALDASWGWLTEVFGGRQSARSIHFIAAMALVIFVAVHLAMVTLSGPINEIRSMITGRFRLPRRKVPMTQRLSRRRLLAGLGLAILVPVISACDRLGRSPAFRNFLASGEWLPTAFIA